MTAIRASGPPLAATNSFRIGALAELVLGAADDEQRATGVFRHDREVIGSHTERVPRTPDPLRATWS